MSRVLTTLVVAACCPLALAAQQTPDEQAAPLATDSAAAAAAIEPLYEQWLRAFETGDADALAALFTADGIYAANTGQVLRGRADISDGVRAWLAERPDGLTLDVSRETLRFRPAGDVAHDLARFVIEAVPMGCIVDSGHALSVWRRQGEGEWRIETLLVNRDVEPPEGACPRP